MSQITGAVRGELVRLAELHGELTPQIVLDAAQDTNNPLHAHFEWDFELAAERYQLQQAQDLIRRARIQIIRGDGSTIRARAFLAVETEDKRHVYVRTEEVASNPDWREQVRQSMERDWKALRRKYEQYEEFWTHIEESLPQTA